MVPFIGRGKSIETDSRLVFGRYWGQGVRGKPWGWGTLSFPWNFQWKELEMKVLRQDSIHSCPIPTVYVALLDFGSQTISPVGFLLQVSESPPTQGWRLGHTASSWSDSLWSSALRDQWHLLPPKSYRIADLLDRSRPGSSRSNILYYTLQWELQE